MNFNFTHNEYELIIEDDFAKIIKWFGQYSFSDILTFDTLFLFGSVSIAIDSETILSLNDEEEIRSILYLLKIGVEKLSEEQGD